MKKILLLVLLTFLFSPTINFACTCGQSETFCETLNNHTTPFNKLAVLRGKVINWSFEEIEVEIIESICEGTSEEKITISTNTCTYYNYEDFRTEEEKEYVFVLYQYLNSFSPPGCAVWYLEIENDIVKGKISSNKESIAYNKLNRLNDCGNAADFFSLKKYVSISPNPTTDEIQIRNTSANTDLKSFKIKIFDTLGKLVQTHSKPNGLLPEESWIINLKNFPSSIYLIQLSANDRKGIFKILKQ